MHAVVGKAVVCLGALILLSAAAVNPWVGVYYQDYIENYRDVMLGYAILAAGLAALLAALGWTAARRARERWTGAAILAATVALILLADRGLLVYFGLPYWVSDPDIGYRHRANSVRVLGSRMSPSKDNRFKGVRVAINRFGHHDDDFALQKSPGQLRGLMLGDSVTMGHGLDRGGTAAHQLEQILAAYGPDGRSHQVINAGVEGYSTNHQYALLRESLAFEPDFITVGLCLNDLTEPAVLNRDLGGVGGFGGVQHLSSALAGWLVNETGYGRLVSWWRAPATDLLQRQLSQRYNVDALARDPDDPRFAVGWRLVLGNLESIYALARERGIDVVLLVYPFTFQLFDLDLQIPQRRLLLHAREQGVDAVDLTPVFEKRIRADIDLIRQQVVSRYALAPEDIALIRDFQAKRYFLDEDHPTAIGNRVVAVRLAEYLHRRGLAELDPASMRAEHGRLLDYRPNVFEFRMSNNPQDVARTAYLYYLYNQEIGKIRNVIAIGLKAATKPEVKAQLYRALGEIERAMGYEAAAVATLRRAAQQ